MRCSELIGHNGNISKVQVDSSNVAVSSGYDAQLLVWNLDSGECLQGLFSGHKQAVMDFAWNNSLVVSADKAGVVAFWDINRDKPVIVKQGHR